ncbi:MAG: DUF3310 domain-containing protein [Gammaproteobacteria bacterium]|nr:DUF3310 domain-containing protein [Gammaproteobacteria bacterium]
MAQSPEHYGNNWKVGDFIVDQNLSFFQANAVKYICRCEYKGDKRKDLAKAIHYLQHELEQTQSDWDDTLRSSGAIPSCVLGGQFTEWDSDSEMFDR